MGGTLVRVLLTRHGETVSNIDGRWQGHQDSPLTPRGLEQGKALADALRGEAISAVYSSDLGRATVTAALIAATHGLTVQTDQRLREIDTGLWTGRLAAELRVEQKELMDAWAKRPSSVQLPGGETLAGAQERALDFFSSCMPIYLGETVAVVTHGTVGMCILVAAMGKTVHDLWIEQHFDNCQIARLDWSQPDGLRVVDLSDTRHLVAVGSLGRWRVQAQPQDAPQKS